MARVDTISAGRLRRQVQLQRAAETPDGAGGREVTWSTFATVWGEMRPLSGKDRLQAEQLQSTIANRLVIRFQGSPSNPEMPFVSARDRVLYKGVAYNIRAVVDIEERRRFLELDLESGVAA